MGILIRRVGTRYEAELTRPPEEGGVWSTPAPLSQDELIKALVDRGCHTTDIGDAFYEADPEWLMRERPPAT